MDMTDKNNFNYELVDTKWGKRWQVTKKSLDDGEFYEGMFDVLNGETVENLTDKRKDEFLSYR